MGRGRRATAARSQSTGWFRATQCTEAPWPHNTNTSEATGWLRQHNKTRRGTAVFAQNTLDLSARAAGIKEQRLPLRCCGLLTWRDAHRKGSGGHRQLRVLCPPALRWILFSRAVLPRSPSSQAQAQPCFHSGLTQFLKEGKITATPPSAAMPGTPRRGSPRSACSGQEGSAAPPRSAHRGQHAVASTPWPAHRAALAAGKGSSSGQLWTDGTGQR